MSKYSKTLLHVAAFAALSLGCGMAQTDEQLKATIPFDFMAGKTKLPAGEYTVASTFGSHVLQIRDSKHRVQATVLAIVTADCANPGASYLTFRVHGTRHYLASTWDGGSGAGRELIKTAAEREAEMADARPTTQITLFARK